MAAPLIIAGVAARAVVKKVATKVASNAAKKASKKDVDFGIVASVMKAKDRGQDPVKFIKGLDKKVNKETIRNIYNSSTDGVPTLSKSQLDKLIGPKISSKKIVQKISKPKLTQPKIVTPSSIRTKDGVFTVKKTPTGKVKITDPKGKSTKLPRGRAAQSYFTNQRPR